MIAEGIQNEEETQVLRDALGVDYGQGYHLARPDRRASSRAYGPP